VTGTLSRREARAYFPAGILLVDRPELVERFAASGALVQGRVAVVDIHGHPREVVRWLVEGVRSGHRAPVGFLHDPATVVYPFAFEPLASLTRASTPLVFRDLGIRPGGALRDPFTRKRVTRLDAMSPAGLVAYAAQGVLSMTEGDAMLAPVKAPRAPRRRSR
jgi:hypothetical protein